MNITNISTTSLMDYVLQSRVHQLERLVGKRLQDLSHEEDNEYSDDMCPAYRHSIHNTSPEKSLVNERIYPPLSVLEHNDTFISYPSGSIQMQYSQDGVLPVAEVDNHGMIGMGQEIERGNIHNDAGDSQARGILSTGLSDMYYRDRMGTKFSTNPSHSGAVSAEEVSQLAASKALSHSTSSMLKNKQKVKRRYATAPIRNMKLPEKKDLEVGIIYYKNIPNKSKPSPRRPKHCKSLSMENDVKNRAPPMYHKLAFIKKINSGIVTSLERETSVERKNPYQRANKLSNYLLRRSTRNQLELLPPLLGKVSNTLNNSKTLKHGQQTILPEVFDCTETPVYNSPTSLQSSKSECPKSGLVEKEVSSPKIQLIADGQHPTVETNILNEISNSENRPKFDKEIPTDTIHNPVLQLVADRQSQEQESYIPIKTSKPEGDASGDTSGDTGIPVVGETNDDDILNLIIQSDSARQTMDQEDSIIPLKSSYSAHKASGDTAISNGVTELYHSSSAASSMPRARSDSSLCSNGRQMLTYAFTPTHRSLQSTIMQGKDNMNTNARNASSIVVDHSISEEAQAKRSAVLPVQTTAGRGLTATATGMLEPRSQGSRNHIMQRSTLTISNNDSPRKDLSNAGMLSTEKNSLYVGRQVSAMMTASNEIKWQADKTPSFYDKKSPSTIAGAKGSFLVTGLKAGMVGQSKRSEKAANQNLQTGFNAEDIDHCSKCGLGLMKVHNEIPRFFNITFIMLTFSESSKNHPTTINKIADSTRTVYGLVQLIKDETDLAAEVVNIYRERSRSPAVRLSHSKTLEECGFEGSVNWFDPEDLILYYDYDIAHFECPILMADHFFTNRKKQMKK